MSEGGYCSAYDLELGPPERCGAEIRCFEYAEFGETYRQWLCPVCEYRGGRDVTDEELARMESEYARLSKMHDEATP